MIRCMLICLPLLGMLSNGYSQKRYQDNAKRYDKKWVEFLNDDEKVVHTWYHYVTTETEDKRYYARVFYPESRQIISYEQYSDKKYKTRNGIAKYWSDDGIKLKEGSYKEDKENGIWKYYDRTEGHLSSCGMYLNGQKEGDWIYYTELGDTSEVYQYERGLREGKYIAYDSLGIITKTAIYGSDSLISEEIFDTSYIRKEQIVETLPHLKQCARIEDKRERRICSDQSLLKYIYGSIRYPAKARELGIEGRAAARFVVNKDGSISDLVMLAGICDDIKKECLRVIKDMPQWSPGTQDGIPVKVEYTLPIVFRLE